MSATVRPAPAEIEAQVAEARKWLYDGATRYLVALNTAIIEILEQVLREDISDEDLYRLSYDYHAQEQKALGEGRVQDAVVPGAKHKALEFVRGKADGPVEEF